MKKYICLLIALVAACGVGAQQLRAPAYPLITVDPYFSVWSFNDTLNAGPTVHWTGKENSLQGLVRVDGKAYYFLGQAIAQLKTVLPMVHKTGSWKYTNTQPSGDWYQADYKDEDWQVARGAFSQNKQTPNQWKSRDIWVRRIFELKKKDLDFEDLMLHIHYDDNVQVYLNGTVVYETTGRNNATKLVPLKEAAKYLKKGRNVLAIHAVNLGGGAYLDAGLVDRIKPELVPGKAVQQSVGFSATQTFYRFLAGGLQLDVTFTAPLLPDDLDLLSRPANYITFAARSVDGNSHSVQLYFSAAANLAVNTPDQEVDWQRSHTDNLTVLRTGTVTQNILGRKGDNVRIDWGHLYLGIPDAEGVSSRMTASGPSVQSFIAGGTLSGKDDVREPRPAGTAPLTLAAAYDLGRVGATAVDRHVILAYDQPYAIEYFHKRLRPWWQRNGQTAGAMLTAAETEYQSVLKKCEAFDQQQQEAMTAAGGSKYAELCALAYRQSIAAHKLVEGPEGHPLFFSKENFSNGSIGTVDITYPSSPLYLYYNTALLKGMMIPILHYSETGRYAHPYAAHDVGTYPIANGQTYGEPMPVEESGNMLVLAAAITHADGNASFAKAHWKQLSIWAAYLKRNGLDPANQLCTDDFAGHLAHNANLSVKAIMGLAGYGYMAGELGMPDTAAVYLSLARNYAREWMAMDAEGDHYKLTFDGSGSWSQKYNLVWDKVLQLDIFPREVADKELRYYLGKQEAYGLPLDSRKTYTKADWILWTATLADDASTFHALMDPVYKYVDETPTRVPLSDWYETTNARQVGFQARSVVGAFFIKALDAKWNP